MAINSLQGLANLFVTLTPTDFNTIKGLLSFGTNDLNSYTGASRVSVTTTAYALFGGTIRGEFNVVDKGNDGDGQGADNVYMDLYKNNSYVETYTVGNNVNVGTYNYDFSTTFSSSDTVKIIGYGTNDFGQVSNTFEDTYGNLPAAV